MCNKTRTLDHCCLGQDSPSTGPPLPHTRPQHPQHPPPLHTAPGTPHDARPAKPRLPQPLCEGRMGGGRHVQFTQFIPLHSSKSFSSVIINHAVARHVSKNCSRKGGGGGGGVGCGGRTTQKRICIKPRYT